MICSYLVNPPREFCVVAAIIKFSRDSELYMQLKELEKNKPTFSKTQWKIYFAMGLLLHTMAVEELNAWTGIMKL